VNDLERDPVVARALRDVRVPDHLPGFWERLDERLEAADRLFVVDDEPGDPSEPVPAADRRLTTSELPSVAMLRPDPGVPREQRLRFLAAAVVLAVVAIGTGLVLRGDDAGPDEGGAEYADQPSDAPDSARVEPVVPDPQPPPAIEPFATTVPAAMRAGATPEDAVLLWVDALGSGQLDQARYLMGGLSGEYLRDAADGMDAYLREASEGYGAWVTSADRQVQSLEVPDAGAVVVLTGTRQAEGALEYAVHAVPVVEAEAGGWYVEPMAFSPQVGGRLELLVPTPQPGVGGLSGEPPDVVVEATSLDPQATYWFSVDGRPLERDDDGLWDPAGELSNGTHLLVVAVTGEHLFSALAGEFVVEG
jgi:hypothetical protein